MAPSPKALHGNRGTGTDLLERAGSIAALWSSEGRRTFHDLSFPKEGECSAGTSLWTSDRRESKMSTERASSAAACFFVERKPGSRRRRSFRFKVCSRAGFRENATRQCQQLVVIGKYLFSRRVILTVSLSELDTLTDVYANAFSWCLTVNGITMSI